MFVCDRGSLYLGGITQNGVYGGVYCIVVSNGGLRRSDIYRVDSHGRGSNLFISSFTKFGHGGLTLCYGLASEAIGLFGDRLLVVGTSSMRSVEIVIVFTPRVSLTLRLLLGFLFGFLLELFVDTYLYFVLLV